jgi:S-adenosylmethionine synthetase
MASRHVLTSESVTEGHPDKICDQVSDAVLDRILGQDPEARVACETMASTGMIFTTGEITTDATFDVDSLVRDTLADIGYTDAAYGLDADTCSVVSSLHEQSPDISQGVDGEDPGAGDQGLMIGYATDETPALMPAPIYYAHRLARRLSEVRREGPVDYLRPDGKSQITLAYRDGEVQRAPAVVVAAQHGEDVELDKVREDVEEHVIREVVPEAWLADTDYYINHTGRFVRGGPYADAGLTGRKVIVDTYGGRVPHGGGAFSGKDPTKVDRSASYYVRYVAKNLVQAGLADECVVQIAYSIAAREPVGLDVDTRGSGVVPDERLADIVEKTFDFSPGNMIEELGLRSTEYRPTAAYGHFGRADVDLPWEATDRVDELHKTVGDKADPPKHR